jgi:AAA family ATP:ADP antiporter
LSGAVGSQSLPLFYGAVFVVMLLLTPVFGLLVARFPRQAAGLELQLLHSLPAGIRAGVRRAGPHRGARARCGVFCLGQRVQPVRGVAVLEFHGGHLFQLQARRKVFSLIALGGMAGAIFGPLVTKLLVQ